MAKRRKRIKIEQSDVDLTPMIDVCFLLIAFFIMVVEVAKQEVIEIFLPHASHAQPDEDPPDNRLIINIDRKGEIYMRSQGYGKPNDPENRSKISNRLKGFADKVGYESRPGNPSKLTVLLRADAHTEYRYVQCVMVMLTEVKVKKIHYGAKNPLSSKVM